LISARVVGETAVIEILRRWLKMNDIVANLG
jgi:hypothetical protein